MQLSKQEKREIYNALCTLYCHLRDSNSYTEIQKKAKTKRMEDIQKMIKNLAVSFIIMNR
jgi:hypothetical protein